MSTSTSTDIAQLIEGARKGERSAVECLFPVVYDDLRKTARRLSAREGPSLTLQPTELVHEAYVRLLGQTRVEWQGRTHFFAVAAMAMRRVLVDRARARKSKKRGGDAVRIMLDADTKLSVDRDNDVLALEAVLERLEALDPRQAKVVELRFFGGLTGQEIGDVLGVSRTTVQAEWRVARAWIRKELAPGP